MHRQRIYNPAQLTPEEREAYFAVRFEELDTLLGLLKKHKPGEPCQNAILLGPRGMGKSTLGLRFLDIVAADKKLSKLWQPIPFPEESYGVSSLGELWAMALQELSAQVGDQRWAERADELLKKERDDERLEEYTYAMLMEFRASSGRTPLLFVENLNLIFDQFRSYNDAHRLRERLAGNDDVFLLAGATHSFSALDDPDEPLFEFLRAIHLHPLDSAGCRDLINRNTDARAQAQLDSVMKESFGRIEAIRSITGGSPRLVALSWRLIQDSPTGEARDDLEQLIDEQTPYFQSQIEKLAPQARKVFNAVALIWRPALAKEIAESARLPTSQASAQLRTLSKIGYVETVRNPDEKKDRYQVVDRFYGIYFLLRFSREKRAVVEGLVDFLYEIYGPKSIWRMLSETASKQHERRTSELTTLIETLLIKTKTDFKKIGFEEVLHIVEAGKIDVVLENIDVESMYNSIILDPIHRELTISAVRNVNTDRYSDDQLLDLSIFENLTIIISSSKSDSAVFDSLILSIFIMNKFKKNETGTVLFMFLQFFYNLPPSILKISSHFVENCLAPIGSALIDYDSGIRQSNHPLEVWEIIESVANIRERKNES